MSYESSFYIEKIENHNLYFVRKETAVLADRAGNQYNKVFRLQVLSKGQSMSSILSLETELMYLSNNLSTSIGRTQIGNSFITDNKLDISDQNP